MQHVEVRQHFNAPAVAVFNAWVKPEMVKRWLFASSANKIVKVSINLIVGGRFSIISLSNGVYIEHSGNYQVIDKPYSLIFTLESPWQFSGTTTVSVTIEPIGNACQLTLIQTGVPPGETEDNWRKILQHLNRLLE